MQGVAGTTYIDESIFADVIRQVRSGRSLRTALRERAINADVYYQYIQKNPGASEHYAQARMESLDAMAEEAVGIADDPDIDANKARVMVDTRKWFLSKLAPKRYGDHLDVSVSTNNSAAQLSREELLALAMKARAALPAPE
jgi:hypothetical protein